MGNDSKTRLRALVSGLQESIEHWRKSAHLEIYDADNLYTYINGGAELYISYQFVSLISQPYVSKENVSHENNEIKIDIFDMGSSRNAYGIFSHSREEIDDFVGPDIESEYADGLLTFWKGRYYISILAYPETESRRQVMQQLARKIAIQIQETSERPQIVDRLPKEKLQPYSIKYFSYFSWMNMYHFFSHKNVLNINGETEVVMAKYTTGKAKPAVLILLHYPTIAEADFAHSSFRSTFMADEKSDYKYGTDQLWTGGVVEKNLLVIVVDAPNLETAKRLIQGVE